MDSIYGRGRGRNHVAGTGGESRSADQHAAHVLAHDFGIRHRTAADANSRPQQVCTPDTRRHLAAGRGLARDQRYDDGTGGHGRDWNGYRIPRPLRIPYDDSWSGPETAAEAGVCSGAPFARLATANGPESGRAGFGG